MPDDKKKAFKIKSMEEGEKYLSTDAKLRCRQMTKVINNSLIGVKPPSKEEKSSSVRDSRR